MKDFLNSLRIPTILGLAIIVVGIISGVFLTVRQQSFTSIASPDVNPQNLTLANISDTEVSISWKTAIPTASFVTFGQTNSSEVTALDDRDTKAPNPYLVHHVSLKDLIPRTTYQYKIVSGNFTSQINNFTTAAPATSQTGFRPIIGSAFEDDTPLSEALVYLSINDTVTQSTLIKPSGNFLIPTSQIRKSDLSDNFPLTNDTLAKLTIISPKGQTSAVFNLKTAENGLPPLKLGQDLDLTDVAAPQLSSIQDLNTFDLNNDGKINVADGSIVLANQGINPKNKKADLNSDGVVDQKDLNLLLQKIKDFGSQ